MNEKAIQKLAEHGLFRGQPIHGVIEETHISWVILTKRFAFKIKKPVKLSFLDFSTPSKRKKYCIRELDLNRRFSPIYLSVLAVHRKNDIYHIGSRSTRNVVDYVVQMKRLTFSKRMDNMLASNKVRYHNMVALAKEIASFHSKAEIIYTPFDVAAMRRTFNDVRLLERFTSVHLGPAYSEIVSKSIAWNIEFLKMHQRRMRERTTQGFTRDVHGDLHSGNIFLYHRPILFDCIEFNDAYRCIDVLSEIAFLCMDLEAFGHQRLARQFLQAYQRELPCFQRRDDRKIFLYYKCFRANVRAKVHALAAQEAQDDEVYRHHLSAMKTYLR
jgi:aminoglycoside phosphotransferase family enzyme